jgi:hypothetical protein
VSDEERKSESTEEATKPQETEKPEGTTDATPEQRDATPREGESPAQPPRESPPTPDEADISGQSVWRQVQNASGFGGVAWEELRKGIRPPDGLSAEQRLWDDRGVSKPQQIDYPKKTWDELPDEDDLEQIEEKISTS